MLASWKMARMKPQLISDTNMYSIPHPTPFDNKKCTHSEVSALLNTLGITMNVYAEEIEGVTPSEIAYSQIGSSM